MYKRPPAHYQQFLRAQFATQTSQTCVSVVCVSAFLSVVISVSLRQKYDLVPCCCFAVVLPRLTPMVAGWLPGSDIMTPLPNVCLSQVSVTTFPPPEKTELVGGGGREEETSPPSGRVCCCGEY